MTIEADTTQRIAHHNSGLSTLERWQLQQTGVSPTEPVEEALLELAKYVEPVETAEHCTSSIDIDTNGLWQRFRRLLNRPH